MRVSCLIPPRAQVQPRRWKVDANSRQDAVLMLSSVNLPGGVQVGCGVYMRPDPEIADGGGPATQSRER
jgi:hypothetical protein